PAMTRTNSTTSRIRALSPTTTDAAESRSRTVSTDPSRFLGVAAACLIGTLDGCRIWRLRCDDELAEFGQFVSDGGLHPKVERHVRAGTAGAFAGQTYGCVVTNDRNQLDI